MNLGVSRERTEGHSQKTEQSKRRFVDGTVSTEEVTSQFLSSALPCSFTYFCLVVDERSLCLSDTLLISLCHLDSKENLESPEDPVCLQSVNTDITSLFIKHWTSLLPGFRVWFPWMTQVAAQRKGSKMVWMSLSMLLTSSQYLLRNVKPGN